MSNPCDAAQPGMTARQMAALIAESPPGPWPGDWAKWDCTRDGHILLMEERMAACPEYPEGRFSGDGIVVSVNAKPGMSSGKHLHHGYLPGAWVLVRELRRLGCTLPITFAYLGHLEWDPTLTRLVEPLGVECLDLRAVEEADPRRPRILAGWESKAYAVLHSRYERVLYLDADNIPLLDPSFLFNSQQFGYFGSIWWPDVPPYDRAEWLPECVWKNIGMSYRDEIDFETGQFMVDKRKCWKELDLAMWMNEHSDYFYRFVFGDKSTFHLAWARMGTNWAIPQRGPGGNQASLVQHDFQGRQLFQHCTRNKPDLHGYPSPGSLLRETECRAHLDELREKWNGRLWRQDNPSPMETNWREGLEGRVFRYERVGIDSRPFRLLQDGRVGRGAAGCEFDWAVWDDGGTPLLIVSSIEGQPTMALRPESEGHHPDTDTWTGRWLQHERCTVRLVPASDII